MTNNNWSNLQHISRSSLALWPEFHFNIFPLHMSRMSAGPESMCKSLRLPSNHPMPKNHFTGQANLPHDPLPSLLCCHEVSFASNFSKALQEHCEVCHQADLEENHRTHEPNVVCLRSNRTWGNELHGIVCIYHFCWNWGKEFFNSVLHPSLACSS